MNKSPQRGTFHRQCKIDEAIANGQDPDTDQSVQAAWDIEQMIAEQKAQREADEKWKKNNLEYDLRSTEWICNKAKASEVYAQNIYAALCNRSWQRNAVWPLLKDETWSCSWRYAGGIVADMREEGDYIDWYCTGIRDRDSPDNGFVAESVVTDEIREDFFNLGWLMVQEDQDQ